MNTLFYVAISNMDMGIAVSIEFWDRFRWR